MQSRIISGAVAGLFGGVFVWPLDAVMTAPTPDGSQISMMQMVAMVVRSESLVVGWIYHLINRAVIGTVFWMALRQ